MIIPYEIGTVYLDSRGNQYKIVTITVKSDSTLKIRLNDITQRTGLFEVTEGRLLACYTEA